MKSLNAGLTLAALAALAAVIARPVSAQTYAVTDLGTLGGAWSYATGINDSCQIVGTAESSQTVTFWQYDFSGKKVKVTRNVYEAFFWTPKKPGAALGTMQALKYASRVDCEARSISSNGQAAGWGSAYEGSSWTYPLEWPANGSALVLPVPGGANPYRNVANGINDSGQVVGTAHEGWYGRAALWVGGVAYDLGDFGAPINNPQDQSIGNAALGINAAGQVVGSAAASLTSAHAFLWTPTSANGVTGTMLDIDPRDPQSEARAINNANPPEVVGLSGDNAFTWDSVHGMNVLGPGIPSAINSAGLIVGNFRTGATDASGNPIWHAAIWRNGVRSDLNTLIPSNSGWTLVNCGGINTNGQIVGWGFNSVGVNHAFLLTPQ